MGGLMPEELDHRQLLKELNEVGWIDEKISVALNWNSGYVRQLKNGSVQNMGYRNAAKLYNFHAMQIKGKDIVSASSKD